MRRTIRILPRFTGLAFSVLLVLTLVVPAMYFAAPHLYQWITLRELTAPPGDDRQAALRYVARHAGDDQAVRSAALERLSVASDRNFLQLVNALDSAGVWTRRIVGDEPWLRWLTLLAREPKPAARVTALERLAAMPGHADSPRLVDAVTRLSKDEAGAVREAALTTAAQLFYVAEDGEPFLEVIASRTRDASAAVARSAWLLLGLIEPARGYATNWRRQPVEVAEALLWAVGRTNPSTTTPLKQAAHDAAVDERVRAMALYALRSGDDPGVLGKSVARALEQNSEAEDTSDGPSLLTHRALRLLNEPALDELGVTARDTNDGFLDAIEQLVNQTEAGIAAETQTARHRTATYPATQPLVMPGDASLADRALPLTSALHAGADQMPAPGAFISNSDYPVQARLAVAEALAAPIEGAAIERDAPLLLRAAATRLAAAPKPATLRPLWDERVAPMRDLACVIAARRFDPTQQAALVEALITALNDRRKQAGAILAGLTGAGLDCLAEREAVEDVWAVKQVMGLGLWMRGRHAEMGQRIDGLLARDDLPRSTILLALLHRQPGRALEHLFHEPGYSDAALVRLFDHYRWWSVLASYLPESAPPFWYWADRSLQRFQVDALRHWHQLHRHQLTGAKPSG